MRSGHTSTNGKVLWARLSAFAGLVLLLSQPLMSQQRTDGGATLSPQEIERRESLKEIEGSRGAYVSALLGKWHAAALEKGFHPSWQIEGFARLVSLSAEQLLAANGAESFEKFSEIVGIGAPVFGDLAADLVYTPVTPCRVLDTRFGVAPWHGPIAGGASISFQVNDSYGMIPSQGGNPAGCPQMPTVGEPSAVAVTLTVVPQATGDLRSYAYTGPTPLASVLNYSPGSVLANTTIVPACQGCGPDITVLVDVGATQIIADVVGYFRPPIATPTDVLVLNSLTNVASGALFSLFTPSCPAGWRVTGGGFVSHWFSDRIFAGSRPAVQGSLDYDITVGVNLADSWLCQGENNTGAATDVRCYVLCSRVPGF